MAKHSKEMLLVQVLDPWEVDLGWRDDVKFQDLETTEVKQTFLSPNFKHEYHERIADHIAQVRQICSDLGVKFTSVTTDTPIFEAFTKIVGGDKRGG